MLLQQNQQNHQLIFQVFDHNRTIVLRAHEGSATYELQRNIDQVINAVQLQNAINHNNLQVIDRTVSTITVAISKYTNWPLKLHLVQKLSQHQAQSQLYCKPSQMNPVENHEQRIQTLETQNLYLRTEVDQLTTRMNELELKMQKLVQRLEQSQNPSK